MSETKPGTPHRRKKGSALLSKRGRVVILAASCLVAALLVLVQTQQSARQESPSRDGRPQFTALDAPATQAASAETRVSEVAVASAPAAKAPAPRAASAPVPAERRPAAATMAAAANRLPGAATPTARVPAASNVASATESEAASAAAQTQGADVTISGCLEQADQGFRLTDTRGEEAPRSRSWRSGFIRRSAASIEVIDTADRLHLPTYVGQRVSVTGKLVDREMTAGVVRIVAMSCKEETA
jgi:hypothetical protein